jgi:hypothetical protein
MDYPLAMSVLALLLGSGTTAYVTKRVLDEMTEQKKEKAPKPPKVRKIVFQQGKAASFDKEGADTSGREVFDATLGVMLDVCSGIPSVMQHEKVAEVLEVQDVKAGDLYKMAASDYNTLLATLEANPELRRVIQRASMERHPLLKYFQWTAGIPGISGLMDKKLYEGVEETLGPKSVQRPQWETKYAFGLIPGMADIAASFYGSTLANKAEGEEEEGEEPIADEASPADEAVTGPSKAQEVLNQLKLVAEDEESAQFIEENQGQLKRILEQMAASGQL